MKRCWSNSNGIAVNQDEDRAAGASGRRAALLDYWDSRHDADQARKRAARLKARLDKLRRVAADLERAGAGAG